MNLSFQSIYDSVCVISEYVNLCRFRVYMILFMSFQSIYESVSFQSIYDSVCVVSEYI